MFISLVHHWLQSYTTLGYYSSGGSWCTCNRALYFRPE